jgi:hypothetical protein
MRCLLEVMLLVILKVSLVHLPAIALFISNNYLLPYSLAYSKSEKGLEVVSKILQC